MGIIADSFRVRINEMKARHDETIKEVEALRKDAEHSLSRLIELTDEMIKELD